MYASRRVIAGLWAITIAAILHGVYPEAGYAQQSDGRPLHVQRQTKVDPPSIWPTTVPATAPGGASNTLPNAAAPSTSQGDTLPSIAAPSTTQGDTQPDAAPMVTEAARPAMPAGVTTRFDIRPPKADPFAESDIIQHLRQIFLTDGGIDLPDERQSQRIHDFAAGLNKFLLEPDLISLGSETADQTRTIYAVLRWSKPFDCTSEMKHLVTLADALNAGKQDQVSMQSYSQGDESVLRLVLPLDGRPAIFLDALQRGNELYVSIATDSRLYIHRLVAAQSAESKKPVDVQTIDIRHFKSPVSQAPATMPLTSNIIVNLVEDLQKLVVSLNTSVISTAPPLASVLLEPATRESPSADESDSPAAVKTSDAETRTAGAGDLRAIIGVNPGLKRADVTRFPAMSLRGFIKPSGGPPMALLEIAELNRDFLVQAGTEIPVTVAGRVSAVGRSELTGLGGTAKAGSPQPPPAEAQGQSQIILRVVKVTNEGVTVEADLLDQTITVR